MEDKSEKNSYSDPFYEDAAHYWEKIPATVDGMLGGFGFISHTDIDGSKQFLNQLFRSKQSPPPGKTYALDCGAGIGRITKNLLVHIFDKIDMVEQNPQFLAKAPKFIEHFENKLGNFYPVGLQEFTPENNKYDIIWCQWVLGHLKDEHLVNFFQRCKNGLRKNGLIIVKENLTSSGVVETDETDSSVTRPLELFRKIFDKASVSVIAEIEQPNFPKGLYPVRMFALKPNDVLTANIHTDYCDECKKKYVVKLLGRFL